MQMLMLVVSHDHYNHVAPHFNHLNPRSAVVPFAMWSASHDTDTYANGITSPEKLSCTSFQSFQIRNLLVLFTVPLASHDQKGYVVPHFDHLDLGSTVVPCTMPSSSHVPRADANNLA